MVIIRIIIWQWSWNTLFCLCLDKIKIINFYTILSRSGHQLCSYDITIIRGAIVTVNNNLETELKISQGVTCVTFHQARSEINWTFIVRYLNGGREKYLSYFYLQGTLDQPLAGANCRNGDPQCTESCTTVQENKCETSYTQQCNTVTDQKCETVYENKCDTQYDNQCRTEYDNKCSTQYEQKCDTVYDTVNEEVRGLFIVMNIGLYLLIAGVQHSLWQPVHYSSRWEVWG